MRHRPRRPQSPAMAVFVGAATLVGATVLLGAGGTLLTSGCAKGISAPIRRVTDAQVPAAARDGARTGFDGSGADGCPMATFYRDGDGDGHGDAADSIEACSSPPGYAAIGDDCDDGCAACHPGAPEICDDVDNDCRGGADDGLPTRLGRARYLADASLLVDALAAAPWSNGHVVAFLDADGDLRHGVLSADGSPVSGALAPIAAAETLPDFPAITVLPAGEPGGAAPRTARSVVAWVDDTGILTRSFDLADSPTDGAGVTHRIRDTETARNVRLVTTRGPDGPVIVGFWFDPLPTPAIEAIVLDDRGRPQSSVVTIHRYRGEAGAYDPAVVADVGLDGMITAGLIDSTDGDLGTILVPITFVGGDVVATAPIPFRSPRLLPTERALALHLADGSPAATRPADEAARDPALQVTFTAESNDAYRSQLWSLDGDGLDERPPAAPDATVAAWLLDTATVGGRDGALLGILSSSNDATLSWSQNIMEPSSRTTRVITAANLWGVVSVGEHGRGAVVYSAVDDAGADAAGLWFQELGCDRRAEGEP